MHIEKVVNIVCFILPKSYKVSEANYTGKNYVQKEITYLNSVNIYIQNSAKTGKKKQTYFHFRRFRKVSRLIIGW